MFKKNLDFAHQIWNHSPKRLKIWSEFIGEFKDPVLVLGMENFEKEMYPDRILIGTSGDYNKSFWMPEVKAIYDTVFCFETLEHLINPGACLDRIKDFIDAQSDVFVSFPSGRPQFLWTNGHFHEFGWERAEEMFRLCGYRIIRQQRTPIIWKNPWEYFMGIRPLLRFIWPLRCRLYHLKLNVE